MVPFLTAILLAQAAPLSGPIPTVLEAVRQKDLFVVEAKLGPEDAWLVLDSGAWRSFLRPEASSGAKVGGEVVREVRIPGVEPWRATFDVDRAASLDALGEIRGRRIAGVLGLDFFRRFPVGIDVDKGQVAVWPTGTSATEAARFWSRHTYVADAPSPRLRWADVGERWDWGRGSNVGFPKPLDVRFIGLEALASGVLAVPVEFGTHTFRMCLDTGSVGTTLDEALLKDFKPKEIGKGELTTVSGTVPTSVRAIRYTVWGIPSALEMVAFAPGTAQRSGCDGILGMLSLRGTRLLIDAQGRSLFVAKTR